MSPPGQSILQNLRGVTAERARRADDAALAARVRAIKAFQQRRFEHTYADLSADPRYAQAARFFLDDLYGPGDFSRRDEQFARIVPALVRLFPADIVETVAALAELHAISEALDTRMALALKRPHDAVDAAAYAAAWRATGETQLRERQVALLLEIGAALDRHVHKPLLRQSLKLMRGPARAAGMGALQDFLEKGFDTFRRMDGAADFLATIGRRERALSTALFDPDPQAGPAALGQST